MEFPSLNGILAAIPKQLNSDMLSDDYLDYVFINNPFCKSEHEILRHLSNYSMATTSLWLTLNQTFIRKPSNLLEIPSPYFDCPENDEIERRGLPTF